MIKLYLKYQPRFIYLFTIIVGAAFVLLNTRYINISEERTVDNVIVIEEGAFFLSPLQGVTFFIPLFLISYYIIERKIAAVERVVDVRLDKQSYIKKNLIIYGINSLSQPFIMLISMFITAKIKGINVPIIILAESIVTKTLYCMIISIILEILRIIKINPVVACFSIYAVAIIDYILSYMLKLINGVLYPYAFYRINLTVSYVYLIIWLMALLLIYRLCRQHVQEFIEDR